MVELEPLSIWRISFSHSLLVESFLRIEQTDFRNVKTKNDTTKIF